MTDEELIARLRDAANGEHDMTPFCSDLLDAANRIEALARKLEQETRRRQSMTETAFDLKENVERLEAALREIADEAAVTVHTGQNGINYKKMYAGWRKIAVNRIDIARAALTQKGRTKAEADRLAALDDLARLGQEYDAETEAGGSIIQGLREAAEYTKGMLVDGDDLIRSEVEFLRSTATDIETGEPLDDDARPDLYAIDARRIANHIETVERELVMWRSHCFAAEARANQMKAALREAANAWSAFKGATISDEHFCAVERLDAALEGNTHDA